MNVGSIAGKSIDRRSFVAASAAATATLAGLSLTGCNENELQETEAALSGSGSPEEGAKWVSAACWHNCGGRCLNKALVKDGVVLRQKTDDTHEDSWDWPQARGCIRGRSTQQQVFGADRLKYPMKRKTWSPESPNGDMRGRDEWERISWDEALDYVANELMKAKEKYGNRSILYLNYQNNEGFLGGVLSAYGGYVDVTGTGSLGTFTYPQLFGVQYGQLNDRYDIVNADYLILWGHNAAWATFGNPSFYLKKFKEEGVKLVCIGPDYNVTAGFVDAEWIPVRPAADTALMLGVAHAMIAQDENGSLIDWDFLNGYTVGFDAEHMPADAKTDENFHDYVMGAYDGVEKTPEWASEICGTPVEKIEHLAEILGCQNNCYIAGGGAPARNSGAENYPQMLMTLGAMGGHFGKPGNACADDQLYSAFNRGPNLVSTALGGIPFQTQNANNPIDDVITQGEMWNAVLTGEYTCYGQHYLGDYRAPDKRSIDIHVIVSEQQNMLQTQTGINQGIEAFRKVDFVCAQAYTMKTDARYADVVMPICTRWENAQDSFFAAVSHDKECAFAFRQVIEPMFEAKDDYFVAQGICDRIGLDFSEIAPYDNKQMWFNMLANGTVTKEDGTMGPLCTITQEDIDRYGVEGTPQEGVVELEKFLDDGVYRVKRSADDAFVYIAFEDFRNDPEKNPLTTTSGKLEIYCQAKADLFQLINEGSEHFVEVSALPKYLEQGQGYTDSFTDWDNKVRGKYPFQITHVHYLRRSHSDGDNVPWLREAMTNPVFINKEDAAAKGIEDGDVILVHNDNGSFIRPATVCRNVMPGVILMPHGAAVRIDDETGIDMAGADNILTNPQKETSAGLNGWNTILVDYEKYTGDIELLPDCDWPLDIPLPDEE